MNQSSTIPTSSSDAGKTAGVLDINKHKQLESQLRKLSRAVEQSPVSIIITDKAGNIEYVNPKFMATTGYSFEEVAGKSSRILKSGEMSPEGYKQLWETISSGKEWHGEFHNRKKNGELFWEWAVISPVFDEAGAITHFLAVKEDITRRKQAEETLATEQRLLNSLITATPDHIYFKDRESRFTRINESFARRHGLSNPNVALGKTDFDLFGEQHARQAYEDEQLIMATGQPMIDKEEREDWKDGRVTWVSSTKMPLRDDTGKIVGIMGISRDITERKRVEEKNLQLAAIVKSSDDAIIGKTLDGIITSWNKGAERIYGYNEDEVVGKPITLLIPAGHEDEIPSLIERIRRGEQVEHYETLRKRKDGSIINVSLTVSPVKNIKAETVGASVVARDITGRMQAEKMLRQSEQKYRELVEHANSIIVRWQRDGEITFLNEFGQKFFGYSAEEILGRHVVGTIVPEAESTGRDLRPLMGRIRADPKGFEQNVNQNMRRNGERVWIAWTNKAVLDEQGQVKEILSIGTDITERKRAELALSDNEKFLNSVIDNIPHMIFVKDAKELRFLKFNKAGQELLGHSLKDLIGKNDYDLFPKELADRFTENDRRVLRGKEVVDIPEEPLQTRDQGRRILHTKKIPVFDNTGQLVYLLGISEDITGRKQVEADLDRERDLWRTLLDNSPDHIYFKDAQSRFIKSSKAQARQFGVKSPDEMVGKTDFDFFTEAHARPAFEDEQEIIRTGRPIIAKEEREVWNDGHVTWASSTKMPMRDDQGKIVGIMGISRDITERKQMEGTLQESQALYHSLVEQLPAGVFRKDVEGRYVFVNSWFCRLKGVKAELFLGKKPQEVAAAELAAGATDRSNINQLAAQGTDHHQQIMQTGRQIEVEEHGVDADGKEQHLYIVKSPIFGSDGKIAGTQGILFDITGRKQTEVALLESTALYHSLVEQMPSGIFRKDRAGRYVFVNSWFCQLRGLRADQMVGRTPDELAVAEATTSVQTHPEILQMLHDGSKHHEEILRTGKPIHVEEVYPTAGGDKRYLHVVKSAVFGPDGQIAGTQGIQFDVTERKLAEEKIREQAALLNEAQDAIWVIDPHDRISYWNKGAERLYGWTAAEAIGKDPVELLHKGIVTPQFQEATKVVNERGEWRGELQEFTKKGKTVTSQARANIIRDDQGRRKSLLIINTDITEKKILEAQFLRSQRMESLGTLAGGIAHDLNNVLTPLLVAVQVLKEKVTDADGKRLLESLETNVQRGAGLVKQVLAFGRGVEGERIVVQPKHIAREIKHIVNETFPKSVAFELHSAPGLWTITGDPTQLHQILLNLCVNARDAMPKGGRLRLHLENVMLDEAYASMNLEARPGPHVCLTVDDTGTGIPKEIQEKIFDPFFTTKEPGKGTGLGLSTTLAIIKSHGGFIHCYSEPGKGSTFKVYLPANSTPAVAENVVTGEASLPRGNNKLVLVVDDEEPIRKLAQRALERYGYRVLLAADGNEALSLYRVRQNEIDVVITDMVMPNLDGPATIAALQAVNPNIKIIGSSGLALDGYEAAANKVGVRHFIPKPYTAETMLLTLHDILNWKI
jgi:PAS domain S-box-containing protein